MAPKKNTIKKKEIIEFAKCVKSTCDGLDEIKDQIEAIKNKYGKRSVDAGSVSTSD